MRFLKTLFQFIRNVANDERIPARDKKVLLAMLGLIASPVDLIPDWIPLFGILDDLLLAAIVLEYFFEVLDDRILLSHYPWGMKSFITLKRLSRLITWLVPSSIKDKIWKYRPSPYD